MDTGNNGPYKQYIDNDSLIRIFDRNIDPIELKWHRDLKSRLVEPLNNNDWLYQEEDKLPILIDKKIFIKSHTWHRVIKGEKDLIVKITEL